MSDPADTTDRSAGAWRPAARLADLPEDGTGLSVQVEGRPVALFRVQDEVFAIDDTCPHHGASLAMGVALEGEVTCPWHALHFELATGRNTDGLEECVAAHAVRVIGEAVEVALAGRAPAGAGDR